MIDVLEASNTTVDRNSPLPLYYQVKQRLVRYIQYGDIAAGEALPTGAELQKIFGVSRITVRRALGELASEGHITRQAGRGTFVLRPKVQDGSGKLGGFFDDVVKQGFRVESQILKNERRAAPSSVARELGVDKGVSLPYVERLTFIDDEPIGISSAFINVAEGIAFQSQELIARSIFEFLETRHNIAWHRAERTLEATLPRERECDLLNLKPDAPVLLVRVIVYDEQDEPFATFKAVYRGDRYRYRTVVAR